MHHYQTSYVPAGISIVSIASYSLRQLTYPMYQVEFLLEQFVSFTSTVSTTPLIRGPTSDSKYQPSVEVLQSCVGNSSREAFDDANIYGKCYDSEMYHSDLRGFIYGHQPKYWSMVHMHDTSGDGFDLHDDTKFMTIDDNEVYHNGYHVILAPKSCTGVDPGRLSFVSD